MANKNVFGSGAGSIHSTVPAADSKNEAGGIAYALSAEETLAQLAVTGTFNKTFYAEGADQLKAIREAADKVTPLYLAQTAIYARQKGGMKDMPAALAVMLTRADSALASLVFDHLIDNGKQLRNYVQMTTSGAFGRSHFSGSAPKRLVARWLTKRSSMGLLKAAVGKNPSLAQIIALAHPKPETDERRALFGYFRGFEPATDEQALVEKATETDAKGRVRERTTVRYRASHLPEIVKKLEAFKAGQTTELPPVDFRFLAGMNLSRDQWASVAKNGRIMQTFKNLATYHRHGVFDVKGMEEMVIAKLKDRSEIASSRLFPYQLLGAYTKLGEVEGFPARVKDALQDTMEIATEKVESYGVPVAILVDVSGSMQSPITGVRKGATTKVRCIDVAALIGATIMRKNPGSVVIPVDDSVIDASGINPRDSVMTIATRLASYGGGGTALSRAVEHLNRKKIKAGAIFIISDMQTWADGSYAHLGGGTGIAHQFAAFKAQNKGAKLVTFNLQAYGSTQAPSSEEVLNIGGFSDAMFSTIGRFIRGDAAAAVASAEKSEQLSLWVEEIKKIDVYALGKPGEDAPVEETDAADEDDTEDADTATGDGK